MNARALLVLLFVLTVADGYLPRPEWPPSFQTLSDPRFYAFVLLGIVQMWAFVSLWDALK